MNNEEKEQRFKMVGTLTLKHKPDLPTEGNLSLSGRKDIEEIPAMLAIPQTETVELVENGTGIPSTVFWKLALRKLAENFLSVKVWTIFVLLWVSAYLCYTGKMTGGEFATLNAGVISTVYALREAFKVEKIRKMTKSEAEDVQP